MADKTARISDSTYRELRTKSVELQFELDKPISMGMLISAALQVSNNHAEELRALLAESK
jgi:hypothetical protein